MPKKKAGKIKQVQAARIITVHSHAYGEHTRAARGSIKPATLNEALIAKGKQLTVINTLASEVHNLLKQHTGFFKESMFWQKMLSRMHRAKDTKPVTLLGSLKGLEMNSRYPSNRFGPLPFITAALQKRCMTVQLNNEHTLQFNTKADAYRYDMIVLFFNAKGKAVDTIVISSKWFAVHEAAGTLTFDVAIPKSSKLYLLCLRIHAGKDEQPLNELSSQGVHIEQAGIISSLPGSGT
jgi:hypothetical protein